MVRKLALLAFSFSLLTSTMAFAGYTYIPPDKNNPCGSCGNKLGKCWIIICEQGTATSASSTTASDGNGVRLVDPAFYQAVGY